MKKLLSLVLAIAIIVCAIPFGTFTFTASAATNVFTYTVSNKKATITGVTSTVSGDLIIPESLGGYTVTTIGESAFYNDRCTGITSVTIPDSITTIKEKAFFNCENLAVINIPDKKISIGVNAFTLTAHYNDSSNWEDGVLYIGKHLIEYDDRILKQSEYYIKDGTVSIATWAFYYCSDLTTLTIPESLEYISPMGVFECKKLKTINYNAIDCDCGTTFLNYNIVGGISNVYLNEIKLGNKVKFIPWGLGFSDLKSISIPKSVVKIEQYAFYSNIKDIWYEGTLADKNKISIVENVAFENLVIQGNDAYKTATWHYETCFVNGTQHDYTNVCDIDCNSCGNIRTAPHSYRWIIDKENNCSVAGVKHEECEFCDEVRSENTVINATGNHKYDNSCDTTCNVCKKVRTISHTYDNSCDTECNVCGIVRSITHKYSSNYNGGYTCNICLYSKTPSKPEVESKTTTSVTLVNVAEFEYSIDGTNWQNSNIFSNLTPNTSYYFYQRVKQTAISKASETSQAVVVLTANYTIQFNSNGGQNAPAIQYKTENIDIDISTQEPIRQGYRFMGWSIEVDGEVKYLPGDTYTINQSITLYAVWKNNCPTCDGEGNITTVKSCTTCSGVGSTTSTCTKCNGSGSTGTRQETGTCAFCSGDGIVSGTYSEICSTCSGTGNTGYYCGNCGSTIYGSSCMLCSIGIKVPKKCSTCGGDGRESVYDTRTCGSCKGTGQKTVTVKITCVTCDGDGNETHDCVQCVDGDITTIKSCADCDGSGLYDCTLWGHFYDNSCDKICNACGQTRATSHHYGGWITTEQPKCNEEGSKYKTCSICGHTVTENIEATGVHIYTNSCDSDCNICGTTRIPSEHVFYNGCDTDCNHCGATREVPDHIYTNTCDKSCNECGAVRAITHTYSNSCDSDCNVCGFTRTPRDHIYDDTCDISCNICGAERSVTHIYSNNCDNDCNVCGVTRVPSDHVYDDVFDTDCNECSAIREVPRIWHIKVNETGVYMIAVNDNYYEPYKHINIYDSKNNIVKYNDAKNGWLLIKDQYYSIVPTTDYSNTDTVDLEITFIETTIFPDTSASDWYYDAVTYAVGAGIMSGYSNGKFGTSDSIQRQDFLVMLARLDGVDLTAYGAKKSAFPDVPENSYFEAAVNWGSENGIVTGYQNGKFGVGDKVTREQLVTFLYRYAKYKGYDYSYTSNRERIVSGQYKDYKNVSGFAKEPILWAIEKGVISGKTSSTIVPQGNAQRCEVAKIMYNIYLNDIFS